MASDMSAAIQAVAARIEADAGSLAMKVSAPAAGHGHVQEGTDGGFAERLRQALYDVNAQDRAASEKMADVDAGRSDDLVGAMLASQEASLSFSLLMQTRNKLVGALEDLIKLQI
ncbi:MAG: flagellar hook-basal body complex protein FliE [Steroidobacteraceae bacterium]|nr:flagellar hook-basal body complex protein FliE [Steroidobacteraceae bacterium]